MRKTFAVGKLTGSTSHILLVDGQTSTTVSLDRPLDTLRTTCNPDQKLADPHTVH